MKLRPVLLFLAGIALSAATRAEEPLRLAEVLQAAGNNFDVALARGAVDGARGDLLAADHSPLPQLTVKASSIDLQHGIGPGNLWRDKPIDKSVGIDWTWERGDKRALRSGAAVAGVRAAEADVQEMRVQQQILALNAFYDLLGAEQRRQETLQLAESAGTLADVMRKRLKAGDVAQQELSRVEIETVRARLDADTAELERRRAMLALSVLIGQRSEVLTAAADWPQLSDTVAQDLGSALAQRPDVQAARARVDAAQAALDAAIAGRKSDVTWGVSLDHYPGTSTRQLELRLQMPLQVGYGQEGEIARARAQARQAEDLAAKTALAAELALSGLWQEARAAALKAQVHENEVLPRAQQVLAQAELAYGRGAMSLTDLLEARRSLRASLLDALAARVDFAKAQGAWQLRSGAL